jgi:hypothetical protein
MLCQVRDLFQYIERYKAPEVELETLLKCFIPEYIPAIGDMDGFVKVCYLILSVSFYVCNMILCVN